MDVVRLFSPRLVKRERESHAQVRRVSTELQTDLREESPALLRMQAAGRELPGMQAAAR